MKKLLLTSSLVIMGLHGMQAPTSFTATTQIRLQQQLTDAATNGTVEEIKKSIAAGASMNGKNERGYTILHFACMGKREANIQYVLSTINPSLINQVDWITLTALDQAIYGKCDQPIIDILRSRGAKRFTELQTTIIQPAAITTSIATVAQQGTVLRMQQQIQQLQQQLAMAQQRPNCTTQSTQTTAVSPIKVECPDCGNLFKCLKLHKCKQLCGAKRTKDETQYRTYTTATIDDIQLAGKKPKQSLED